MALMGNGWSDAGNFNRSYRKDAGSSLLMVRQRLVRQSCQSPKPLHSPPSSGEFFCGLS
jgi:hypothetical protein